MIPLEMAADGRQRGAPRAPLRARRDGTGRDGTGRAWAALRGRSVAGASPAAGAARARSQRGAESVSGGRHRAAAAAVGRARGAPSGGWRGGNREAPALGVRVAEQGGVRLGGGWVWVGLGAFRFGIFLIINVVLMCF